MQDKTHPTAQKAFALLRPDAAGKLALSEAAAEELTADLIARSGKDLCDAVNALVRIGLLLHGKYRNEKTGMQLLEIAELAIPGLEEHTRDNDIEIQRFKRLYSERTGATEMKKAAPSLDAPPPDGTIPLSVLRPRRHFGPR